MTKTAKQVLDIARKYIGVKEGTQQHKNILDRYNNHKPLAVGYKVKTTDDWCDVFVSSIFIEAGETGLSGTECGVERHIQIFKKLGIWEENGSITPKSGYVITYNWGDTTQSNDGFADHIGFVESVSNGMITTLEGNYSNMVKRRTLPVGSGVIRGYAKPKYANEPTSVNSNPPKKAPVKTPTKQNETLDIDGKLGSKTITRMQQYFGTPVDGIISKPNSNVVRSLQKWLGVTVDGDWGYNTTTALQKRLGTPVDGIISKPSSSVIKELQRRLNKGKL